MKVSNLVTCCRVLLVFILVTQHVHRNVRILIVDNLLCCRRAKWERSACLQQASHSHTPAKKKLATLAWGTTILELKTPKEAFSCSLHEATGTSFLFFGMVPLLGQGLDVGSLIHSCDQCLNVTQRDQYCLAYNQAWRCPRSCGDAWAQSSGPIKRFRI